MAKNEEAAIDQQTVFHSKIALELCFAILKDDNAEHIKLYASLFSKLYLDKNWPLDSVKKLIFMIGHLSKIVSDKTCLNYLKKFYGYLSEFEGSQEPLEQSESQILKDKIKKIVFA